MSSELPRRARLNVPSPNPERTSYARFIPREELHDFASWTPGSLGQAAAVATPAARAEATPPAEPTAEQWQARIDAARQHGYENGYREGIAALEEFKTAHERQLSARLAQFMQSLDGEFDNLHAEISQSVARIAVALARQVVRSELQLDPRHVADVAAEAVEALVQSARHVSVHVHPQDLPLVAEGAKEALQARGARLLPDADVARGGCRVRSDAGSIEADIATLWAQAARALGSDLAWDEGPR
ncbi:MAG TPA: FliH/SctL family protein [Rubrivivax sp.]|nr:FliH/SctL family protein [Rubrivivax sp.]